MINLADVIKRATRHVNSQPEWKQNILERCNKPTVYARTVREYVDNKISTTQEIKRMTVAEIDAQIAELQKQKQELKKSQEVKDQEYLQGLEWIINKTAKYLESSAYDEIDRYSLVLEEGIEHILKLIDQPQTLIKAQLNINNVYIEPLSSNKKGLHISAYHLEPLVELVEKYNIKVVLPSDVSAKMALYNRLFRNRVYVQA